MDITPFLAGGELDSSFPLPTDHPFTQPAALAAGLTRRQLSALLEAGALSRPIKGVYVASALQDTPRLRADCLRLVVPADCVVVDRHAGWLLGAQMILAPNEHLGLRPLSMYRPSGHGRLRNDYSTSGERNLRDGDVIEIDGIRVTTPLRTACDLGRVRYTSEAISGLDAMLRTGAFGREELVATVERFRRMRWITTLRAIAPVADGRSESPGESVLRLRCLEVQLPMVPQIEVTRSGLVIARLDLANERLRAAAEYDGAEWHSSPTQLAHDRARRQEASEEGYLIRPFTGANLFTQRRDVDDLLMALKLEAEARFRRAG